MTRSFSDSSDSSPSISTVHTLKNPGLRGFADAMALTPLSDLREREEREKKDEDEGEGEGEGEHEKEARDKGVNCWREFRIVSGLGFGKLHVWVCRLYAEKVRAGGGGGLGGGGEEEEEKEKEKDKERVEDTTPVLSLLLDAPCGGNTMQLAALCAGVSHRLFAYGYMDIQIYR